MWIIRILEFYLFIFFKKVKIDCIVISDWVMDWIDWAVSGVNKSIPHYAGPLCESYLNSTWRRAETFFVLILAIWLFRVSYKNLSKFPTTATTIKFEQEKGRMLLLVLLCLVWGMEIGYKFSSRTAIYLLMPCHITTALQVKLSMIFSNSL